MACEEAGDDEEERWRNRFSRGNDSIPARGNSKASVHRERKGRLRHRSGAGRAGMATPARISLARMVALARSGASDHRLDLVAPGRNREVHMDRKRTSWSRRRSGMRGPSVAGRTLRRLEASHRRTIVRGQVSVPTRRPTVALGHSSGQTFGLDEGMVGRAT
jgi:hypothetical protein